MVFADQHFYIYTFHTAHYEKKNISYCVFIQSKDASAFLVIQEKQHKIYIFWVVII